MSPEDMADYNVKRQTLELEIKLEELRYKNAMIGRKEIEAPEVVHPAPEVPVVPDDHELPHTQRKNTRGFKVQQYKPDGTFVKCFGGITEATRFCKGTSITGMRDAINKKTIYHCFRWHFLSRDLADDTIEEIGETKAINQVKQGFIAFLTRYGESIHDVFPDQKSAMEHFRLKSSATISKAIKENRRTCGYLVKYYDDCSDALKTEYQKNHTLPEPPSKSMSRLINMIDPITKKAIKTFNSISDVILEYPMSRITLDKAIQKQETVHNFLWSESNKAAIEESE
jgi:hypothetical protein